MSLIVAVYVPTGIALSGDSRTTGAMLRPAVQAGAGAPVNVQTQVVVSDAAEKVFLVFGRFAVGTFGDALVNNLPIAHYVEQFELGREGAPRATEECARDLLGYFLGLEPSPRAGFIVCGYDGNEPQVYAVDTAHGTCERVNTREKEPERVQYGIVRGGDTAIVNRLLSEPQFNPVFETMNLQDAVDYSRHLIRSTIDQMRFEPRFPTVGGAIDTIVLSPRETRFLEHKQLHT